MRCRQTDRQTDKPSVVEAAAILDASSVNPLISNNVGTLVVDGWAVTCGTARGLGGAAARPGFSSLYQM